MSDEHPGFEYWEVNDPKHAYPVGQIDLKWSDEGGASASADMTIPAAQPTAATVAERSIGVAGSTQLWFGLECTTQAGGQVTCEAVLRGKHVHWYPEHNETAPGPVQELRVSAKELKGGGRKEALAAHGPHCDLFSATWFQHQGKVGFDLTVTHWATTPAGFLELRKRAAHDAERLPRDRWRPMVPDHPAPSPTPAPRPRPRT